MPSNLRLYHTGVGGMKNMFEKKVEDHRKTQLDNPFSEWEGAGDLNARRHSKNDDYYGRPLPGSKSERRAQAAHQHILMDIKYLCYMIWDCAEWTSPDGRSAITFGKLFNLYNAISDKVVGTLLRARKRGFVHFEGEMLYQRKDDNTVIELSRNINTIRSSFGETSLLVGGGEVEPWGSQSCEDDEIEENSKRRSSLLLTSSTFQKDLNQRRHSVPQAISREETINHANVPKPFSLIQEEAEDNKLTKSFEPLVENGITDQTQIYPCDEEGKSKIEDGSDYSIQLSNPEDHNDTLPIDNSISSILLEGTNEGINCSHNDTEEQSNQSQFEQTSSEELILNSQRSGKTDANCATEQADCLIKPNPGMQADIVSILGQFVCNLTFARSNKGMVSEEIKNTANKLHTLFCLQARKLHE